MHGWDAQKSQWSILFPLTQVLFDVYDGSVSITITVPKAFVLSATKYSGSPLYEAS